MTRSTTGAASARCLLALVMIGCGPSAYALSPTQETPRASWADGATAARAQLAREHGNCPDEWIFVRERGTGGSGDRRHGRYEVYGCAATREYRCEHAGDAVACRSAP